MKLSIIGSGLKGLQDLSLRAYKVMVAAERILLLSPIEDELNKIGVTRYESLYALYKEGDQDTANYRRLVNKVSKEVFRYTDTALVVQGHPLLGVSMSQMLVEKFRGSGVKVVFYEGISSFDGMINDLKIDPLERGVQLYDVNRLLLYSYPLNIYADLFLYHISSIGNKKTDYHSPQKNNQLNLLKDFLLQFYRGSTRVYVLSSKQNNVEGFMGSTTLNQLETLANKMTYASSLFIRGRKAKQLDEKFLRYLI